MNSRERGYLPLESAVMEKIVAGAHPILLALRAQYENSRTVDRHMTGVGFRLYLETSPETPGISGVERLHLADVVAELEGLQHGAGFVLHLEGGKIRQLEGFSYDESWPTTTGRFTLSYADGDERIRTTAEMDEALRQRGSSRED